MFGHFPMLKSSTRQNGFAPDVVISNTENKILYRHRQDGEQHIYWLTNRSENPTDAEISFRISGKIPELWNPISGKTERISYKIVGYRTIIPVKFDSWDSYFIVFKEKTQKQTFTKPPSSEKLITEISGNWNVTFDKLSVDFPQLGSWTNSPISEVKYFSGTAIYRNSFQLSAVQKRQYLLDLGEVKNIAEVIVNGKNMGTLWKRPFKLDISEALHAGENHLEIKVTNLWVNRLIGDAQPEAKKVTFTTIPFYKKDSQLLPSGLLSQVAVYLKQ